jgi:hypothetical protein
VGSDLFCGWTLYLLVDFVSSGGSNRSLDLNPNASSPLHLLRASSDADL